MSKVNESRKIIYADDLIVAIRDDISIRGAAFAAIVRHINAAPVADAAPVVHGGWINTGGDFECSACGRPSEYVTKYCDECGAVMDLPKITDAATAALVRMGAIVHGYTESGRVEEVLYGGSPCTNLPRKKV